MATQTDVNEKQEELKKALANVQAFEQRLKDAEANGDSPAAVKEMVAKVSKDVAKAHDELSALKDELDGRMDEFEKQYGAPDYAGGSVAVGKAGHLLAKSVTENKHTPKTAKQVTREEFKTWNFDGRKTITDAEASGAELIVPQYEESIIEPGTRTLRIRNLLPIGQTNAAIIFYMKEESVTDNATSQVTQGSLKGESDFTFNRESAEVVTIAHFVKVSTQMLEDVSMLRSYINTRMRFLLLQEEEQELLYGDGTPGHLNGLVPQATAFDATLLADLAVTGATDIDRLRAAMLQVELAEYAATGFVMNPFNWAALELRKDGENRYIFSTPQNGGIPRMWGLPVVSTTAMTRGTFLTGAFMLGAQIWDKMQAAVQISTEDDDNFRRNLATIRAEERLGLTVYRPESFVKGSFSIGGSGSGS